jgi:ribose-phosphate pyrophosphokinase
MRTSRASGLTPAKIAVLIDDMCDTGETLGLAAQTLTQAGAEKVYAIVSHGASIKPRRTALSQSPRSLVRPGHQAHIAASHRKAGGTYRIGQQRLMTEDQVTNTINQRETMKFAEGKLETMDVSPILAESIRRTHNGAHIRLAQPTIDANAGESISLLFTEGGASTF